MATKVPKARAVLYGYVGLSLTVLVYVSIRAWTLGFTHDESLSYTILRFRPDWVLSANNHWLSTVLSLLVSRILGYSEVVLRLPSVLSFLVYSYFCYQLVVKNSFSVVSSVLGVGFLLLNHFLIEFFGLFRGYGMAMGLFAGALYYLLKLSETYDRRDLISALILSVLTIYANYAFLVEVIILQVVFVFFLFMTGPDRRRLVEAGRLLCLELVVLFPAAANLVILKLNKELYFGRDEGFVQSTLTSVCSYTFKEGVFAGQTRAILATLGGLLIVGLFLARSSRRLRFILLVCVLSGVLPTLLHWMVGVKYAIDRTSLFWVLLLGVLFHQVVDLAIRSRRLFLALPVVVAVGGIVAFSIYSGLSAANTSHTTVWSYDRNTREMLVDLEKRIDPSRRYQLGISWVFEPTINYYREVTPYGWLEPVTREGVINEPYHYYYCFDGQRDFIQWDLEPLVSYPSTRTTLYKRK